MGGAVEYFCDADYVTDAWKPNNYRVNRFSEWHLVDGIEQRDDGKFRPSLATAKAGAEPGKVGQIPFKNARAAAAS